MRVAAAAVVFAALALAPRARAAPPAEPDDLNELYAEAHPQPRRTFASPRLGTWYGWQILLADLSFIGIFATVPAWGNIGEGGGVAIAFDIGAYLAVAPAIHGAHGDDGGGALSLALHAVLPLFTMLAGIGIGASTHCDGLFCGLSSAAWGAYGGIIVGASFAMIIDAAALAWEKPDPHSSSSVAWSIAPFALRGGAGIGLGGSF